MWQTEMVAEALNAAGMETTIKAMETVGDKVLDTSIAKIGSKGVFTQELEEQLASGVTDIAVHSAKDMQSQLPEGFALIAFTRREQVNDVLVSDNVSLDIDDTVEKDPHRHLVGAAAGPAAVLLSPSRDGGDAGQPPDPHPQDAGRGL